MLAANMQMPINFRKSPVEVLDLPRIDDYLSMSIMNDSCRLYLVFSSR
jgi:hypothetical protein